MKLVLTGLLAALVTGSIVYCAMVVFAVRRYLRDRRSVPADPPPAPPFSILKPLHGLDDGLDENLRSFFRQDYPEFEVLLGIDHPGDPALPVAERIRAEFPGVPSRIVMAGDSPYSNPKDHCLETMAKLAAHDLLVMSDSDIRVTPGMLRVFAGEFADPNTGCITCPYRAVPGSSFWTRLEAIGMNTEFMSGILVARMLEGMRFGVGPTMVVRKEALEKIGWMSRVGDSYIDDFLIGKYIAEAGYDTELSGYVIEHRIGSQPFLKNIKHRVMWQRGARFSRPAGYFGQLFTYPVPLAALMTGVAPGLWPVGILALVMRYAAAYATALNALHDPLFPRWWFWLPFQDILAFLSWAAALFGNSIQWRGRRYKLGGEGKLIRC